MMKFLVICLLLGTAASLAPIYKQKDGGSGSYIVKLKDDADFSSVLDMIRFSENVDKRVRISQIFTNVFNGFAASLSDELLMTIRGLDDVEYVEEDGIVTIAGLASWGLDRIDEKSLQLDDSYTPIGDGGGVNVYVIDTGINEGHNDFQGRAHIAHDSLGGNGDDCHGHGTHCAGTVAGAMYGVAKKTEVYGVRCLDCSGSSLTSIIVAACDWTAGNAILPAIASMSLGGLGSHTMDDAVQRLITKGILVAVAAGNDDDNACKYSPARATEAITVGATDDRDARAYFSNYGVCVDIFAPGVSINSAWIGGTRANNTISGTSMATPHVAGAAAILLSQDNSLTPQQLKETLQTKANADLISDSQAGTPNLLLYIGEGNGGGFVPPPVSPPTACGTIFTESGSQILSPGYPGSYDNYEDCHYSAQAPAGMVVQLSFESMDIESYGTDFCFDTLKVFDGDSSSAMLIETLCGSTIPDPVYSTQEQMFLRFESDSTNTGDGFVANVAFVDQASVPVPTPEPRPKTGCGSLHTDATGTLATPNYPSTYPNNANCDTTIQGQDRSATVTLTFDSFNVESSGNCQYDYLLVYDGADDSFPFMDRLCGSVLPSPITSTGPDMYLKFVSDYSVGESGISAHYVVS